MKGLKRQYPVVFEKKKKIGPLETIKSLSFLYHSTSHLHRPSKMYLSVAFKHTLIHANGHY